MEDDHSDVELVTMKLQSLSATFDYLSDGVNTRITLGSVRKISGNSRYQTINKIVAKATRLLIVW